MKRVILVLFVVCILAAVPTAAFALAGWQESPAQGETSGNSGAQSNTSLWGYIANANEEGLVDVDMDGIYDFNIVGLELLDVSVPLKVGTVAMYNGANKEFYSSIGIIRNNSKVTRARMSLISFTKDSANTSTLELAPWGSMLTQDNFAMKMMVNGQAGRAESDVSQISASNPFVMGPVSAKRTMEYTFDAQFIAEMADKHIGEIVDYNCVFKFELDNA